MDSLTSEELDQRELAKVVKLGQLLFGDLSYAVSVLDSIADEANHIRHMQNHRESYDPLNKQRPHRWEMPALTQHHIAFCWCFNDWVKAIEKEATEKKAKPLLTQQDFLRAYCAYLFGQTLYHGSAAVAIALGCHYWRYPPRHIGKLNVDLIKNPHRDSKFWRAQLQARFRTVAHDSQREVTKDEHNWVIDFLDLIAPTSHIHDPSKGALRRLLGDLERSQDLCQTVRPLVLFQGAERSEERTRLHALLARCCGFGSLPPAYKAAVKRSIGWLVDPDDPTVQPCIPTVPGDTDVDFNNPSGPWGLSVPPTTAEDLTDLLKRFGEAQKERQQRRQQYRAGVLEIRVDGVPIGKFDVQAAQPFQFEVPCDACRVQIYGQDEVGDLLLAVFPMAEVVLDTWGKTVTLQLTAARQADGTLAEELVELTYVPRRCGAALARRIIAAMQAVKSVSVHLAWQARHRLFEWWKKQHRGNSSAQSVRPGNDSASHFEDSAKRFWARSTPVWRLHRATMVIAGLLLGLTSGAGLFYYGKYKNTSQITSTQHIQADSYRESTLEKHDAYPGRLTLPSQENFRREETPGVRSALVIGIDNYLAQPRLQNPANDAHNLAETLRNLGFDVIEAYDITRDQMRDAVKQFEERLQQATVGLFFFAGHGVSYKGDSYLMPVEAQIASPLNSEPEAVSARRIVERMEASHTALNIAIFDTVMLPPFQSHRSARGIGPASSSLAYVPQLSYPKSFVVYTPQPEHMVADGIERHGTYMQYLLQYIKQPGLSLSALFEEVNMAMGQEHKQNLDSLRRKASKRGAATISVRPGNDSASHFEGSAHSLHLQQPTIWSAPSLPPFCFAGCTLPTSPEGSPLESTSPPSDSGNASGRIIMDSQEKHPYSKDESMEMLGRIDELR